MDSEGWATIPATQTGFLRVSMNKAVTGIEVGLATALTVLEQLLQKGSHMPVECAPVPAAWPTWLTTRIQGYRQVTDAGLIATAHRSGCVVATVDSALLDLVDREHSTLVHLVPI
jgi:predicted nucleic acid-binding protein